DALGGMSVGVGVDHPSKRGTKLRAASFGDTGKDCRGFGLRVKNIAGMLAALLTQADVDGRERQRAGFHDAAGGVAEHHTHAAKQAPVSDRTEVDEESRRWMPGDEAVGAIDE